MGDETEASVSGRLQAAIDRAKYLAQRSARNKLSYERKIARGECGHCSEQTPICKHCSEEIGQLNNDHVWYHEIDCGPDRHQSCDCHCAECDPRGRYTHRRACIDGESAEPEGESQ